MVLRILILSVSVLSSAVWATEVTVSAGVETFAWREYAGDGTRLLEESGPRYFVQLQGRDTVSPLLSTYLTGRFYSGVVGYESDYMQDPSFGVVAAPAKVKTDVDYNGMRFEIGLSQCLDTELSHEQSPWWLDVFVGLDQWRRHLRDTHSTVVVRGGTERYHSLYGRMGPAYRGDNGLSFLLGVKWPFITEEQVKIDGRTATLYPEGRLSLYADLYYAWSPNWLLSINYDSYRFGRSDAVVHDGYLIWQPESHQDTLALAIHYRF